MNTTTPSANATLPPRDLAAALFIVVVWGVNFVVMKAGLKGLTPFQLGAARYLFSVLPLVFFIRPPKLPWQWVALYGAFQGLGQFGFLFFALRVGMTASLASVLLQTQVFFTALLGFVFLRERVGRPLQLGLLLAALAIGCFAMTYVGPQGGAAQATTALGFVLNLCAASMWAASNIVARRAQRANAEFDPLAFVVWASLVPIVPFLALSWAFDGPAARGNWLAAGAGTWAAVAFLGWVATLAGYSLWTGLLKRHAANKVAPFSLGVPVVGLTSGMVLLGETIGPWQWAGIVGVIAALACVLLGPAISSRIGRQAAPRLPE